MNKKILIAAITLVLALLPFYSFSATIDTENAGFIPANIWYSNDPDTEGEKVRIYTVLFNPYQKELSGTVSFYDGEVLLGKKNFTIPNIGTKEVYIDWTVTLGTHKIFAKITDTKYLVSKGVYEPVKIEDNTSETSSYTVYKPVLPKFEDVKQNVESKVESIKTPVNNIQEKVVENTPEYISQPIVSTTNFLENWREGQAESVNEKKTEVKSEIEAFKEESSKAKVLEEDTTTLEGESAPEKKSIGEDFKKSSTTPFKYVELFFLTILSFVLGSKIAFYGVIVIVIATLIKFAWGKIFN